MDDGKYEGLREELRACDPDVLDYIELNQYELKGDEEVRIRDGNIIPIEKQVVRPSLREGCW